MDAHTSYYGEKYTLQHPDVHMKRKQTEESYISDEELAEIKVPIEDGREGHDTKKMFESKTKRQKTQDSIDEVTTNMSTVTVGKSTSGEKGPTLYTLCT